MNGIYYKEGIYVLIDSESKEVSKSCIQHPEHKPEVNLFGNRVKIKRNPSASRYLYAQLEIGDVPIVRIYPGLNKKVDYLTYEEIVAHLNAIEVHGVDAFIQNYKQNLNFVYNELQDLDKKTESLLNLEKEESTIKKLLDELSQIRKLLISVLVVLFNLNTYMSAGLENEKVLSVCQSIIDSLA